MPAASTLAGSPLVEHPCSRSSWGRQEAHLLSAWLASPKPSELRLTLGHVCPVRTSCWELLLSARPWMLLEVLCLPLVQAVAETLHWQVPVLPLRGCGLAFLSSIGLCQPSMPWLHSASLEELMMSVPMMPLPSVPLAMRPSEDLLMFLSSLASMMLEESSSEESSPAVLRSVLDHLGLWLAEALGGSLQQVFLLLRLVAACRRQMDLPSCA